MGPNDFEITTEPKRGEGAESTLRKITKILFGGDLSRVNSAALEASHVLKASPGKLISLVVFNTNAGDQYIQLFDSATLPADGVVPVGIFKVPADDTGYYDLPLVGLPFSKGIVACNSSTAATKTIGAADCLFTAVVR